MFKAILGKPLTGQPAPDKVVTIYDREGSGIEVSPVDAREILAGGEYFAENPVAEAEADPQAEQKAL